MRTELVAAALTNAAATTLFEPGAILHSDRGSVYTSRSYRRLVAALGMRSSMGRTGAAKNKARQDIVRYIEGFYNPRRRHSAIGYRSPNDVHYSYRQSAIAA